MLMLYLFNKVAFPDSVLTYTADNKWIIHETTLSMGISRVHYFIANFNFASAYVTF